MTEPLAALADIELPDAPAWTPTAWLVLLVVAAAALAAAYWLARSRFRRPNAGPAPREEAQRRLDRLRTEWQAGKLDDRETAYRLCALLRVGLGLPQLDAAAPPPPAAPDDWSAVISELRRLRYRADERGLEPRLFEHAAAWLAPEVRPRA